MTCALSQPVWYLETSIVLEFWAIYSLLPGRTELLQIGCSGNVYIVTILIGRHPCLLFDTGSALAESKHWGWQMLAVMAKGVLLPLLIFVAPISCLLDFEELQSVHYGINIIGRPILAAGVRVLFAFQLMLSSPWIILLWFNLMRMTQVYVARGRSKGYFLMDLFRDTPLCPYAT